MMSILRDMFILFLVCLPAKDGISQVLGPCHTIQDLPAIQPVNFARTQLREVWVPVVFHNIYREEDQRVEMVQIEQQLRRLNLDFNRQNRDSVETPHDFRDLAESANIHFCLASFDPDGNPSEGIHWKVTNTVGIGITDDYYQEDEGGITAWDPSRYLNIWICEIVESGEIAGFAEMPANANVMRDGVVADYRFFAQEEGDPEAGISGRTVTHEVGHWLGLRHIWGDAPGCDTDDGIDDTPNQFDRYRGCPESPKYSCGSEDMFMNFMDLVHDSCMNLFTRGQVAYMHQQIDAYRKGLLANLPCDGTTSSIGISTVQPVLYPNPVHSVLHIEGLPAHSHTQLVITDLFGRSMGVYAGVSDLSVRHLVPGRYLLQILTPQQQKVYIFTKI